MANEEKKDLGFFENFWWNLKRIWADCLVLILLIAAIVFLPAPESGLIALGLAKLMFISAGIIHAHITRKLMWSYIDFNQDTDIVKRIMIVVWYAVIIWGWARGG